MDQLRKLYVEITTACNLNCRMCVRHAWREVHGSMRADTFRLLIDQLKDLPSMPVIHFGGYGEPMSHPDFMEFAALAKEAGAQVEVTTNGTLLNRIISSALIDIDLDRLYVSIDSVSPEGYENIRVGSNYDHVISSLRELWRMKLRRGNKHSNPQVGIAFVAMRRNIEDLPRLPRLATYVGAWEIKVSNVVPHTPEMESEVLYERSLRAPAYRASNQVPDMSLPKLDVDDRTLDSLCQVMNSRSSISLLDASLSERNDYCRFVQKGFAAVRWDGEVSPCLPLLHDHPEYVLGRRKDVTHFTLGNIVERPIGELWASDEYVQYRERLRAFPFSPCTTCGGCERFAGNYTDCQEQTFPTCGGCLWAQGFVQCP